MKAKKRRTLLIQSVKNTDLRRKRLKTVRRFPVAIPRRLIRALTLPGALVLDPFMGSGTTGVAAILENRKFAGAEIVKEYYDISAVRLKDAADGNARIREDKPVIEPNQNAAVAKLPEEFRKIREGNDEKGE